MEDDAAGWVLKGAKRRAVLTLLITVITCGAASAKLATTAVGQMPQSLVVTTSAGPSSHEVGYQLRIQSGADGAQFGFEYGLPEWPTTEPVFGSPVKVSSVGLLGPGSISSAPGLTPKPVLRIRNGCTRAIPDRFSRRYWVEMPANSNSTVNLLVRGTYPAWPGTKYGVTFSTFAVNDPVAELVPLASINVPRPMPRGTRIGVESKGQLRTNATPELVGRTFPPFRLARISLRVVRPSRAGTVGLEDWAGTQSSASLGAVWTDSRGRFRVSPRPFTGKGKFAVIARSEARGARATDWNCGAFFSIG